MRQPAAILKSVFSALRNNPDYGGALAAGYGLTVAQVLLQIVLVPLYVATLGQFGFGALMVLLAYSNGARLGLTWLSGRMLRVLGSSFSSGDLHDYNRTCNTFRAIYIGYGLLVAGLFAVIGLNLPDILLGVIPVEQVEPVRLAILWIAVYIVGQNWLAAEVVVLAARKRQFLSQISLLIGVIVFAVLAIPTLLVGGNIGDVAICFAASTGCSLAFCFIFAFVSRWGNPLEHDIPGLRDLIDNIRPQVAGYAYYGALGVLLQADTFLVGILGGANAAAHFVLVWKIAEVVILLLWRFCDILQPEIINMDMSGDRKRISRVYARGIRWLLPLALLAGTVYALLGADLVRLWVGTGAAPTEPWAFALAGGAILWLTMARLPSVLVYSLGRLRPLNIVASVEAASRLVLTVALFPALSFLAPLVAINAAHLLGLSVAYYRMGRRESNVASA